jgi:hypothetical protein
VVTELNQQTILEHITESLCSVRGLGRLHIDTEVEAGGGDLRIDSKEGEAICVLVEDALELGELVQACDLEPEQLTSISSLARLFDERIANHSAARGKDAA